MSTFRWRGTASSVWNLGGNWIDELGNVYAGGRYPGSMAGIFDDVILDTAVTNGINGYDAPGAGNEDLRSFKVTKLYDKGIGSLGTPLVLDVSGTGSESIIDASAATVDFYLTGGGTYGFDRLSILDMAATKKVYLYGRIGIGSIFKGQIILNTGVTVATLLHISYISSRITDAAITIATGVTLTGPTIVNGGTTTCASAVTSLDIQDGDWGQIAGNMTTVRCLGGTVTWNAGNTTTLYAYGGSFSGASSVAPRTLTTGYVFESATLNLANGARSIIIGNRILNMTGTATIITDPGTSLVSLLP